MDGRTGMLNKQGFSSLVTPLFEVRHPFSMGFLMVDNYHELEKIYGFTRLESRLTILTDFLKQHSGCVFSRLDNLLFCFMPANSHSETDWKALLRDLEEDALSSYLKQEGIGIRFQVKIGMLNCPQDVESFEGLMELIDVAAQLPMEREREVFRLSSTDIMKLRRRRQIDEAVRSAVRDESLFLVYQPIYDVANERFVSAEALLRMRTEQLGFVSPGEFIRVAEENGSILQLTQYVVESACQMINTAKMKDLRLKRIHVNLSAIDCAQGDLASRILDCIRRNGVDTGMLSTEITETAFGSLPESILANLTDLSRAGVDIMLDDFGTGYSNLNRLYSMPLDVVKVDKSLVDDILTSEPARIVMENTIQMMKRLNKKVLVEGVETKEQAEYLIAQGVNYIQGYYYAKPMDAMHLEALFRQQKEQ